MMKVSLGNFKGICTLSAYRFMNQIFKNGSVKWNFKGLYVCEFISKSLTLGCESVVVNDPAPNQSVCICTYLGLSCAMRSLLYGKADTLTYSNLLDACINAKAKKLGSSIHKQIILNGLGSDVTLNTKMIIFYSKVRDMVCAQKVFDQMPQRTIVSWTALLSGYCQNEFYTNALMVFQEMHSSGIKANQFTFSSALKTCTRFGNFGCGLQIHGRIRKSRFIVNPFVQSALVDFYSKCGDMEDASLVFQSMSEKDLACWNTMIGGFALQGFANNSFRMFQLMLKKGVFPDCFTFVNILNACTQGGHLLRVSIVHKYLIQQGLEAHDILVGLLVDAYAKCGSLTSAIHMFKSMSLKNVVSCTAMISAYAREGNRVHEALNFFTEMHRVGIRMDGVLLCLMINICAHNALLSLGRLLHALIFKYHPGSDAPMCNSLIDMYAKCGELVDSKHVFDAMEGKNVISWSSLIGGYARHGNGHNAIQLFKNMESEGFKPNVVTFLSLLFACSHSGLVDEGRNFLTVMVNGYKIAPREKHYSCMVDLYSRAGKLDEALYLIRSMQIDPSPSMWNTLLGACSIHGHKTLGEVAAWNLFSLDPANFSSYIVLSSIYAAGSLWENSWNIRARMKQSNVRKCPGHSYIFPSFCEMKYLLG